MVTLEQDYPKLWKAIERKEIPKTEIDKTILNFVLRQCTEINEGKRNELDVGDAFGIGIQHALAKGYKFSPIVEDFLIELGEYKITSRFTNIKQIEQEARKLLKNLKK